MTDNTEFTSACLYFNFCIDLDAFNNGRLKDLPVKERREILAAVIESFIIAVPKARQRAMFSCTEPDFVMGMVRKNTMPLTLANAFEKPIPQSPKGYSERAAEALKARLAKIDKMYNGRLGIAKQVYLDEKSGINGFVKELLDAIY
jgi:hypothetical protein